MSLTTTTYHAGTTPGKMGRCPGKGAMYDCEHTSSPDDIVEVRTGGSGSYNISAWNVDEQATVQIRNFQPVWPRPDQEWLFAHRS